MAFCSAHSSPDRQHLAGLISHRHRITTADVSSRNNGHAIVQQPAAEHYGFDVLAGLERAYKLRLAASESEG